jgi:glyoxylase-like metal-dependent hydrolase (beta-lactamase superfamily II)
VLRQVADGVHVHQSEFCQSNAVVVQGASGVLLVDPGIQTSELDQLAQDVRALDQPVVAGFSTHPHWDHLLWHADFGTAPRYATAICAAAIQARLSDPGWQDFVVGMMPTDIADDVPLDLFGLVTGLPADTTHVPWDGPKIRVLEHRAHAPGHAALLVEGLGVLIAGDMLSDVLVPLLGMNAADPVDEYLAGLQLLDSVAGEVDVLVPGHGSVCGSDEVRARLALDRAYVHGLRDARVSDDPRIGPSAPFDWVAGVHERQVAQLALTGEG